VIYDLLRRGSTILQRPYLKGMLSLMLSALRFRPKWRRVYARPLTGRGNHLRVAGPLLRVRQPPPFG
jgi:hypothetical protein